MICDVSGWAAQYEASFSPSALRARVAAVSSFPNPRAEPEPLFGNVLSDIVGFFLPGPRPRPHRPRPRPRPLAPAPASYGPPATANYDPPPPAFYGYLPSYSPTPVSDFN